MADTTTTRGRIVNRARTLHKDGYQAKEVVGGYFEVKSPEGAVYQVDAERGTCTCWADHKYGYCKHRLGLSNLLFLQRVDARLSAWATTGLQERGGAN